MGRSNSEKDGSIVFTDSGDLHTDDGDFNQFFFVQFFNKRENVVQHVFHSVATYDSEKNLSLTSTLYATRINTPTIIAVFLFVFILVSFFWFSYCTVRLQILQIGEFRRQERLFRSLGTSVLVRILFVSVFQNGT